MAIQTRHAKLKPRFVSLACFLLIVTGTLGFGYELMKYLIQVF